MNLFSTWEAYQWITTLALPAVVCVYDNLQSHLDLQVKKTIADLLQTEKE